jgi:hypothetical protein
MIIADDLFQMLETTITFPTKQEVRNYCVMHRENANVASPDRKLVWMKQMVCIQKTEVISVYPISRITPMLATIPVSTDPMATGFLCFVIEKP